MDYRFVHANLSIHTSGCLILFAYASRNYQNFLSIDIGNHISVCAIDYPFLSFLLLLVFARKRSVKFD